MATRSKLGPLGGSVESPSIIVTTWEDSGSDLNESTAKTHADTVRPASLFGGAFPTGDVSVTQRARNIYTFEYTYEQPEENEPPQPEPPETGSLVRRGNCSTKSKTLVRFIEPVGVYNESGDQSAYYADQKWSPKKPGPESEQGQHGDVTVEPLQETRTLDYYIPNLALTEVYYAAIEAMVEAGAFNDATFAGKLHDGQTFSFPTATVQIVRVSLQERSPDDWELSLGFGIRGVKTNVSINDDLEIPTLRACDHYYVIERPYYSAGGDLITNKAKAVVVGQAWPLMDFSVLDLPS